MGQVEEKEPVSSAEAAAENPDAKELAEYEAGIESRNHEAITNTRDGVVRNRADDNVRIKIVEKINTDARVESPLA